MDLSNFKELVTFDQSIVKALMDKEVEKKQMSDKIDAEKEAYRVKSWNSVNEKLETKRTQSKQRIAHDSQMIRETFVAHQKHLDDTFNANRAQWIESITKNIFD